MNKCQEITLRGKRCKNGINCYNHHPDKIKLCSICLGNCCNKIILDCGHSFCEKCIYQWFISKMPTMDCPNCRKLILQESLIKSCVNWGIINGQIFEALEIQLPFSSLSLRHQGTIYFEYGIETNKIISYLVFQDIKNKIQERNDYITDIFNELISKKSFSIVHFSKKPFFDNYHYYVFV